MILEPIQPPARRQPSQTLAAYAQGASTDGDRWQAGVTFMADCGPGGLIVPVCDPHDPDDAYDVMPLDEFGERDTVESRAVQLWVGRRCSTRSEIPDLSAEATAALDIDRHRQLEREFWTGATAIAEGWDNPYLTGPSLQVVSDDDAGPSLGLGMLAEALGECSPSGRGLIHASRSVFAMLVASGVIRREGQVWLDPFDNFVLGAAGYTGEHTGDLPWLIATGPVEARFSPTQITGADPREWDLATNDRQVRATQYGGAWFDPCCHFGIAIDPCAETCTEGT